MNIFRQRGPAEAGPSTKRPEKAADLASPSGFRSQVSGFRAPGLSFSSPGAPVFGLSGLLTLAASFRTNVPSIHLTMGQQTNKHIKKKRRLAYHKRRNAALKAKLAKGKK